MRTDPNGTGALASHTGLYDVLGDTVDFAHVLGRTAIAGVVGGTASAIGGGKFANGAYTAAFQHLLNAELGKAAALAKASRVRSQISELYKKGVKSIAIPNSDIDLLARNSLHYAQKIKGEYYGISFEKFLGYLGGKTGDSVFLREWPDAKFNVTANGGMAPVGLFYSSDINYYYYTMVSSIYYGDADAGAILAHSANFGWNIGEWALGNDLGGPPVSYDLSLGQIERTIPWVEYGSNIYVKYKNDR